MMIRKIFLYALLITFVSGCNQTDTGVSDSKQYCLTDSLLKKCSIDTVKSEMVTNELNLTGKITFNEDNVVKIVPLAGGHVQDVKVSLGDFVNEGQILAIVKSSDMAGFYNDFVTSKSNLAIAKKNFETTKDFYKSGLSSEKDLVTAEKEFQKAQSSFNKNNEIIKIYGGAANADENTDAVYYIKSPINGFVVDKNLTSGTEIRYDDNTTLFTISGLKNVWVIANLYETDMGKIQIGYEAEINTLGYKDKIFKGKIDKMSNVLNPETKALNVRISLDNPDYLLKPGMFAHIVVHYPENKKMLSVPKTSVVFDENKNFVVKYDDKCKLRMQQITSIKTVGDRTFFESYYGANEGINKNDRVITRNALFVFTALKKL